MKPPDRFDRTLLYICAFALAFIVAIVAMEARLWPQEAAKHADDRRRIGDPTLFPPGHVAGGKPGDRAIKAIVLTRFGSGQCSGAVIEPRLVDGAYHILTAWHCDPRGGPIRVRLYDQRVVDAVSVYADQRSDIRWLRTVSKDLKGVEMATLSKKAPAVGTRVWHRSFGIDKPGNLETGVVTQPPNGNGQIEYRISVSPGDSGGPALDMKTDFVYSPWCCTTRLSGVGRVWGGSCVIAWHVRPGFSSRATADEVARTWSDAPSPALPVFAPLLVFADHIH